MSQVKGEEKSNELTKDELEKQIAKKKLEVVAARAISDAIVDAYATKQAEKQHPKADTDMKKLDLEIAALYESLETSCAVWEELSAELLVLTQQFDAMNEAEQTALPTHRGP